MMAESGRPIGRDDEAQRQYQTWRAEKDKHQKEFLEDLDFFPHLFSLRPWLCQNIHRSHIKALLERQEAELKENSFPYFLEKTRCRNLIIFLLYHLGRTRDAFKICQADSEPDPNNKSIIFLTIRAVLQWDLNDKQGCVRTVAVLKDFYKAPDCDYQRAVAESEKAYLLISIGPKGFLLAVDHLLEAFKLCPNSEVFLWKYDLALAIRRNFNIHAYSEHRQLSASELAKMALEFLSDVASNCPKSLYKARATVELSRLVIYLKGFAKNFAREADIQTIQSLCEEFHETALFERALEINQGTDFYVLRECGRHFMHMGDYDRTVQCLDESLRKKKNSMIYHVFGKMYLYMFSQNVKFIPPASVVAEDGDPTGARVAETLESGSAESSGSTIEVSEGSCWSQCPLGECPVQHDPVEAEHLAAEFDRTPFLDEAGNFMTTQANGVGSIFPLHPRDSGKTGNAQHGLAGTFGQRPCMAMDGQSGTSQSSVAENTFRNRNPPVRAQSAVESRLQEEFEASTREFLNPDGSLRTSQPDGIGSIRPPQTQQRTPEQGSRPPLQNSYSFPPPARFHNRTRGGGISRVSARNLLQCGTRHYNYDISDPRIKTAENFYLKGIELNPNNFGFLYDIGRMYENFRNWEKALDFYERIIVKKDSANALNVVNAYEGSGICLLNMSEESQDAQERERLKERAEDMFMSSLVACRQAVAHLPRVSANRASLWNQSYASLLDILRHSEEGVSKVQKEAEVHELVGRHLEAIKVYQEVMALANTTQGKTEALQRTVSNHLSMSNVKGAKFILDLFLASDEREFILKDENRVTKELRVVAAEVYSKAFRQALAAGNISDAHEAFRTTLVLKNILPDENGSSPGASGQVENQGAEVLLDNFDVCIFHDDDENAVGVEELTQMSDAVSWIMRTAFGMRVSANDEGASLGTLSFLSELHMAKSAPLVVLVIAPGSALSPRMKFIADTVLQSRYNQRRVLTIPTGDNSNCRLPSPLDCLQPYAMAEELLPLAGNDVREHTDAICRLFDSILQ